MSFSTFFGWSAVVIMGTILGHATGKYILSLDSTVKSSKRTIIELQIELTKLEIKKLKGVCNG